MKNIYLTESEIMAVKKAACALLMEQISDDESIYDRMRDKVDSQPGKKFELSMNDVQEIEGHKLYRVRALKDFVYANKGDLGGYVEFEENLSQDGACWILNDAIVCGQARVKDNARVGDDVRIFQAAEVGENAMIFDNAKIFGRAKVHGGAWVKGNAKVQDNAEVYGFAMIDDNGVVKENAKVYDRGIVRDDAIISGNAEVFDHAQVLNNAIIKNSTKVHGVAKVRKSVDGDIDEDSINRKKL